MADIADKAAEQEQWMRESHLRAQARRSARPALPAALECDECGAEIPAARRAAVRSVRLCVDCQRAEELDEKRHAR